MVEQDIPAELIEHIASYSSCASLAILAQTSTGIQGIAEHWLYSSISVKSGDGVNGALEAVAQRHERASYIRAFSVQAARNFPEQPDGLPKHLILETLEKASNLQHLRINLGGRELVPFVAQLNKILRSSLFSLQILLCDPSLDLLPITRAHPLLRFLGLFPYQGSEIETVSALQAKMRGEQLVVANLIRDSTAPHADTLEMFADNLARVSTTDFTKALKMAFVTERWQEGYLNAYVVRADYAGVIDLYFDVLPLQQVLLPFCRAMVEVLCSIMELRLHCRSMDDMFSDETTKSITLFPLLREISFGYWAGCVKPCPSGVESSPDRLLRYANIWGKHCPNLWRVCESGSFCALRDGEQWAIKDYRLDYPQYG